MSLKFTSVPNKLLKVSIDSASTALVIDSIEGWNGVNLTSSDFGSQAFGCLRNPTNTEIEFFEWDPSTIANGTTTGITILTRGLKFDGDITTSVDANKKDWIKNNTIVMLGCDVSQVFQWLKEYIDDASVAGAVDGTTVLKGIFEEATQAEIDADTAAGGTSARLVINPSTLITSKYGVRLPSADEKNALAGGATFGTPSTSNKFVTQEYLSGGISSPVIRTYVNSGSPHTWTKPAGLKYVVVEVQAAGGSTGTATVTDRGSGGGGAGGYSKKLISAGSLGATETVTVGAVGASASFGSHCSANSGSSVTNVEAGGAGGTATGGDINITGQAGQDGRDWSSPIGFGGKGGDSMLGQGGHCVYEQANGVAPAGYGAGAGGPLCQGTTDQSGATGGAAIVIVTEYYN